MKKFIREFKEFAMRGNVLDMAVGIVVGGAFTAIVNSLVNDLINPLMGLLTGGRDFSAVSISVGNAQFMYGNFITAVVNFLLIAFVLFTLIKAVNRLRKPKDEPTPPKTTKSCPFCKTEIPIEATRCPHCTSVLENEQP